MVQFPLHATQGSERHVKINRIREPWVSALERSNTISLFVIGSTNWWCGEARTPWAQDDVASPRPISWWSHRKPINWPRTRMSCCRADHRLVIWLSTAYFLGRTSGSWMNWLLACLLEWWLTT